MNRVMFYGISMEDYGPFEGDFGETGTADFYMEGLLVECSGLPASVDPGETVSCFIEDYVAEGFQVLWWLGVPSVEIGYGFGYPFED